MHGATAGGCSQPVLCCAPWMCVLGKFWIWIWRHICWGGRRCDLGDEAGGQVNGLPCMHNMDGMLGGILIVCARVWPSVGRVLVDLRTEKQGVT